MLIMQVQLLSPAIRPLPVIVPLSLSTVVLLAQNVNLIAECQIERFLDAHARLRRLNVNPLSGTLTLVDLDLRDANRRPLLSIPRATARFRFSHGLWGKPRVVVKASTVHVSATLLYNGEKTTTNWSQLAVTQESTTAENKAQTTKQDLQSKQKGGKLDSALSAELPLDFSLTVERPRVTLYTSNGYPLVGAASLPTLHITSKQVSTVTGAATLVDGIVARVVRQAGIRSLPNEFRRTVRQWARTAVGPSVVDEAVAWSKLNIAVLRHRVQQVNKAVDQLPGLDGFQSWTNRLDSVLAGAQRVLPPPNGDSSAPSPNATKNAPPLTQDSNHVHHDSPSFSEDDFRELEEE